MKQFLALFFWLCCLFGQGTLHAATGTTNRWTPHLAYHDGTECVVSGQYVYALMGENLLIYDTAHDAVAFVDRVSAGLSDKRIKHIGYSATRGWLVILYTNGNIDLYRPTDGLLVNLPAIKQAMAENLTVDRLRVQGDDAFFTTNKGFVWIDLARRELKGHFLMANCNDVLRVKDRLLVATDQGVKSIGILQNFSDPALWSTIFSTPVKHLAASANAVYLNVAGGSTAVVGTWRIAAGLVEKAGANDFARVDLLALKQLQTGVSGAVYGFNDLTLLQFDDNTSSATATTLGSGLNWLQPDGKDNFWIGRNGQGFVRVPLNGTTFDLTASTAGFGYYGPRYDMGYFMQQVGNRLLVACGRLDPYDRVDTPQMAMIYERDNWTLFETPTEKEGFTRAPFENATCIAQSPTDANRFAVSTGRTGIYLYHKGTPEKQYTRGNSPLVSAVKNNSAASYSYVRTDGVIYDKAGNLFVLNNSADTAIWALRPDGTWKGLYVKELDNAPTLEKTMIDADGRLWVTSRRTVSNHNGGFLCLDYNGTLDNTEDDVSRYRTTFLNQDGSPCSFSQGLCFAQDRDGAIWLGTNEGIFKIEDPKTWFDNDFHVTQVKVPRNDGTDYADYLLAGVPVTAIAVDGANRKWVGTQGDGVYLLSPDGVKTIHHFKTNNSPLFSDNIWSIACHPSNGNVMISTDAGMIAYRSDAAEPQEQLARTNVRVYPNPFRPTLQREVSLDGLTADADVRVTTTSGSLVYAGRSQGGLFRWDGRDSRGRMVASGVYYFHISNADGSRGITAKVAVVR